MGGEGAANNGHARDLGQQLLPACGDANSCGMPYILSGGLKHARVISEKLEHIGKLFHDAWLSGPMNDVRTAQKKLPTVTL